MAGLLGALQSVFMSIGKGVVGTIPGVVAAVVVLIVGYLVALLIEWIVSNGLSKLKFDEYAIKRTNLKKSLGSVSLEYIFALVAKWYTFALFLMPAADVISMPTLAAFLKVIAAWVPTLIGASLLGLFGVIAADYTRAQILATKAKSAGLVADFVKGIILVVTALVVLKQVGLDITVVENSLFIILSGVMLAISLALGLGFGLALKDEAKKTVRDLMKKL